MPELTKELAESARERFEKYTIVTDSCWIWNGPITNYGYAKLGIGRSKSYHASQVAYLLYVSDYDRSLGMLHKCDNKLCVNPNHLYPGTDKQNVDDKVSRNRLWNALDIDIVKAIKQEYLSGQATQKQLAIKYDCTQSCISRIVTGARWSQYIN